MTGFLNPQTRGRTRRTASAAVELSTQGFSWDRSGLVDFASAEASELGVRFFVLDEPVVLVSHRTGRRLPASVTTVVTDSDGDVLYWEIKPSPHAVLDKPMTVVVYND